MDSAGGDSPGRAESRWSTDNPGNRAIHDDRSARLVAAARRAGTWPVPGSRPLLDLGCGSGEGQRDLIGAGLLAVLRVGVDRSGRRLGQARLRSPGLRPVRGDGVALPFATGAFDAVSAFTVFSSIPAARRAEVAAEVGRVLAPGGIVLWYDMRLPSPGNAATNPVPRKEVAALFPGFGADLEPATVLPPLVRRLGPLTSALYPMLAHVPGLSTHLVGVLQRP